MNRLIPLSSAAIRYSALLEERFNKASAVSSVVSLRAQMQLLSPWHEDSSARFTDELAREIAPGHALYGLPISALARRSDRDDVLFAIKDGSRRVAVVHLSYSNEKDPRWPRTSIYPSIKAWYDVMRSDHAEFDLG